MTSRKDALEALDIIYARHYGSPITDAAIKTIRAALTDEPNKFQVVEVFCPCGNKIKFSGDAITREDMAMKGSGGYTSEPLCGLPSPTTPPVSGDMPEEIWCHQAWSGNFAYTSYESAACNKDTKYTRADKRPEWLPIEALRSAFLAGFKYSAEGFNGEFPFQGEPDETIADKIKQGCDWYMSKLPPHAEEGE